MEKPSVLVLGGTGFIGRNLVNYLVENDIAGKIRVVDKVIPAMAWLNTEHSKSFSKVEYIQANLIKQKSVSISFRREENQGFDYVINCAGETKLGQSNAVYEDGIEKLSCNCAKEVLTSNSKRYIEISSAYMHATDKTPATEQADCKPWQTIAKHKLNVEKHLKTMSGLDYLVVRPPLVYGPGSVNGITRRMVIAAIYKYTNETMQLLWSKDLVMNTVHVEDLVKAIWFICLNGKTGEIYNVCDDANSTQGSINSLVCQLFDIQSEFLGSLASSFVKLSLDEIAEDINEKHSVAWGALCQACHITTPLSPLVQQEQLLNKNLYIDGSKLKSLGFEYKYPKITIELLKKIIEDFVEMKLFPPNMTV